MICCDEQGHVIDSYVSLNPQGKYGADVISRIRAAADPDVLNDMKYAVTEVLKKGTSQFLSKLYYKSTGLDHVSENGSAELSHTDVIGFTASGIEEIKMYISANTTMSYLLLGLDPAELGEAPFNATHISGEEFSINLQDPESGSITAILLPGFSAFVGSDIYAGILATHLCSSEKYRLLCDLGTNGEIALGNKDRLLVTATAAGPAFEGGPCKGIWGADMIHFASVMLGEGLMDATGLLSDPYFDDGITIGSAMVTQESIRALQLAKGAMRAGIKVLCDKAGISYSDISDCILAGGFGYYLDPADAARTGLIPEELMPVCRPGGNTSLAGALEYALQTGERKLDRESGMTGMNLLPSATVINLAEEAAFNDFYMNALNFENI
jgi:uncharacterized 2Fe-2S/4Fe-4S cluster protein (DUF4445 family)